MQFDDFSDIPRKRYEVIMADPPWSFSTFSEKGLKKSAQSKYDCMSLAGIQALPVAEVAAADCLLWLWCTNPMLPQGLDTLRAWGFTFKTAGHWVKRTKNGLLGFGTGYILRSAGEPFLIGTRGKVTTTRSTRSVIDAPIREHSRKPDEAYEAIDKLVPRGFRLDMFSRERRPGWDAFGNETETFADQLVPGHSGGL